MQTEMTTDPVDESLLYLYDLQQARDAIKAQLDRVEADYQWGLDQILKSGKKEGKKYILVSKSRDVRVIDFEKFKEVFPTVFSDIRAKKARELRFQIDNIASGKPFEINVREAEDVVGRIPLAKACDIRSTVTYTVQMKKPEDLE